MSIVAVATVAALAVLAALVVAAVLVVAGVAKLGRPEATAVDFAGLGVPWPSPMARIVPMLELTIAACLVVLPGWGAVAAFGLLTAFTSLLITVLRSGRHVACACFGVADRAPVSTRHLVRNLVLGGLCVLASTFDGPIWSL